MHILHITPYYAPAWAFGGVASAVTGLATAQAALGHHVSVLTTDALGSTTRNPARREAIEGVHVIRIPNVIYALRARLNLSSPSPVAWRAALSRIVADVIHVHEFRTVENLLGLPALRNPVVLSPHGTLPYGTGRSIVKRAWDRLFGQRLARRIDRIAALTSAELDDAQELWASLGVSFPEAAVIPNGVSADLPDQIASATDLRARYGLGDGPVVLFFARLHERKGLQFLIPAFAQVAAEFPAARLFIAGPDAGMRPAAEAQTRNLGIAERIVFAGMLSGQDRLGALATGDLFVLPAVGEGLPMAALEAMAAGMPVILTPGCNLPDIESRGAGLLVERETDALAAALRTLLTSPIQRRAMGENGQRWIREAFTWPVIAARMVDLY
jgi:glycosyltransferase involved in cell wall biosynthesis